MNPYRNPVAYLTERTMDQANSLVNVKDRDALRALLVEALTEAHSKGVDHALASESRAWKRVGVVEDCLTEIVRHLPGSTMAKAKALAAEVDTTEEVMA